MAITNKGYINIWKDGKHVYEHRWLIEQKLGRKLLPTEQVHHRNGIRDDNRLSNLELCRDAMDHRKKSERWGRKVSKPCFCGSPAHGRGLCKKHYARQFRQAQGW
jgi:hypothetical protein